jgi:endonuclease YncB( thermonuclease family)
LTNKIGDYPVHCSEQMPHADGGYVALCLSGGEDLGEWMIINGWAVAETDRSYDYNRAQSHAERARQGLWRGRFVMPWLWREGDRLK